MRKLINCSTTEKYDQRSDEYQTYLVERGYNPSEVSRQFEKAKALPRGDLLASKPCLKTLPQNLVVDYNPHLPNISKIIKSFSHLIYESPLLSQIFPKGSIIPSYRRPKNIKEILARPKDLIIAIITLPLDVLNVRANAIYARIILSKIRSFTVPAQVAFIPLDRN